jgi:FlaA1/EpsC-like NDP-sugar epimerase
MIVLGARVRRILLVVIDVFLINAAFVAALDIRFDGNVPEQYFNGYIDVALYFTVIFILSYFAFGLYKKIWQYASIDELLAIVYAVTVGTAASIAFIYFIEIRLPRSIFVLGWILNIVFIGSSRLGWRLFRERFFRKNVFRGGKPLLIVGAGDAGALLMRELKNGNGYGYNPVGFVDDDAEKQKKELMGLPVLGTREDIPDLVEEYSIQEIIIAMPSVPGAVIRKIVNICRSTGVKVSILPAIHSLMDGKVNFSEIREVQVEDLLRREPVKINLEEVSGYLKGKVALVTGAGGSIGSELCRQIIRFSPKSIILMGHDENPIFEIEQELKKSFPDKLIKSVITNIREKEKVNYVFDMYRPQVVFHAAAHKHVPLMELNPEEAVKNNVLGTKNVAEAADKVGTETFILISTDKAVNPTNVMGATKRVAEMIIQSMDKRSDTKFVAVRFGNVLGSRGSVLPVFKKQIAEGGPVTITHPDMTRYFMTIPEAVQLVIQAGAMAEGGEIFVLDMGKPVKIEDMARDLITLSGLEPDKDIEIVYTGIRPGEKLYEELLTAEEGTTATKHKRIFVAKPLDINTSELNKLINQLERLSLSCRREDILHTLKRLVPTYRAYENQELKQQVG